MVQPPDLAFLEVHQLTLNLHQTNARVQVCGPANINTFFTITPPFRLAILDFSYQLDFDTTC